MSSSVLPLEVVSKFWAILPLIILLFLKQILTYFFPTTPSEIVQAPKFDVPLEPVMVIVGDKLSLKCHVGGSPPMKIYWMKDRKELKSSENTRITFGDGTACLEISPASKTDAGDYLCKASNPAGTDFCKSRVTVRGKVSFRNLIYGDNYLFNICLLQIQRL